MKIFPAIDRDLIDRLKAEADAASYDLESEIVDLADTITQWQMEKLKRAEERRRRKDDL